MDSQKVGGGFKERLDDFLELAQTGQTVQLRIAVYQRLIKQVSQSGATDDIDIEMDMRLLMADFMPISAAQDKPAMVTKVYAICPVNESEIEAKTTRHIANERLRVDFDRLRDGNVQFEETYF
jgi:hypothetical protein